MLSGNRALIDNLILIPLHRPHSRKSPPACTPCYCHRGPILVLSRPALSLCCPVPAMTREKHYISSTSLVVRVCRLACLLDVTLETVKRIWHPASSFVWS